MLGSASKPALRSAWRSAWSSLASVVLISPIRLSPVIFPRPVGSMPYSEGRTMVTRMMIAVMTAMMVDLMSLDVDGSSA